MSIRESIDCGIIMPMLNNTSLWFILGGVKFGDFQRFWHFDKFDVGNFKFSTIHVKV